jgi:nucleoside-diphosphate-sugar epimerase
MTKPLVLITGGAGFLGINLCRLLLARGYEVRSLDIAPFDHAERATVDVMLGDVRDSAVVAQAMRGISCVVHAASAAPPSTAEEIFSTNVAGTWTVLQTAVRHRVPRFVFLSFTTGGSDLSIDYCAGTMGGDDPSTAYAAAMLWYQGYPSPAPEGE